MGIRKIIFAQNKKRIFLVIVAISVLGATYLLTNRTTHNSHLANIEKQADAYGQDGDMKKAIPLNVELYKGEPSKIKKAALAYQISTEYFALQDVKNGNAWANSAISLYRASGETNLAQSIRAEAIRTTSEIQHKNGVKEQRTLGPDNDL